MESPAPPAPPLPLRQRYGASGCQSLSTKVCFEMKLRAGNSITERVPSITFVLRPRYNPRETGRIPQKNKLFPKWESEMVLGLREAARRWNVAFSRRLFLRHGVLAAAAACAGSPLLALGGGRPIGGNNEEAGPLRRGPSSNSGSWQDHASALDHMGRDAFAGAIGTNFKVFLPPDATPVWVTLLAVQDLPRIAPANTGSFAVVNKASSFAPTSSGFILVFGGSSALPQATHLFEHDGLGRFALFTVPEGNGRQLYTAVVNRLDEAHIIAVPYATGKAAQNQTQNNRIRPPAQVRMDLSAAATSSAVETHPDGLSGSPAVRRSAVRD